MAIRYYYIDDDPLSTISETAKGLSITPERLLVTPHQHRKWEEEIEFLIENQGSFDGLLFDWGLIRKNESGDKANFNVEALAQQIRRLIIDNKKIKKDFPIILCSAQFKFKEIFTKELSSHDLFDAIFEKDDFNDCKEDVILKFYDLAMGYQILGNSIKSKNKRSAVLSIFQENEFEIIDDRISDYLLALIKENKPNHEIARFLLSKIIRVNGMLIDKFLLASRLGIDIVQHPQNDEWEKLQKRLEVIKYKGVFSLAWERWWMVKLTNWWESTFNCSLGSLTGPERVELLNKKFKLKLLPAEKMDKSRSDFFWVKCKETNRPLSIEDAVTTINSIDKSPWEEDEYWSINVALEKDSSLVHSLERERLQSLKKMYTKIRKR